MKDRIRLRQIVLKTHRNYFAADPSVQLIDSLIDGLGPEVAGRLVKRAVDSGKI